MCTYHSALGWNVSASFIVLKYCIFSVCAVDVLAFAIVMGGNRWIKG